MRISNWKFIFSVIVSAMIWQIAASDSEANSYFAEAKEKEKSGSYRKAAKKYLDADFSADSSVLKGNALIAAARSYRKAELYGEEFDCLTRLLREHLSEVDFSYVANRLYKIGDLYYAGHRDKFVDWIPFIKRDDRSFEIYEAALKTAPCLAPAGETRLRLARMYIDEQKSKEAMKHLRDISKLHAGTPVAKAAMLELCSLMLQMSKRGDGDHVYSKQAIELCDTFLQDFPDAPETQWVKKTRQTVHDRMAERIYSIGRYYYKSGKPELAERYLADVVKNYADTKIAPDTENLLAKIDSEFEVSKDSKKRYKPIIEPLTMKSMPKEDYPIMITPEESNGRWLLPVRNLRKSQVESPQDVDKFYNKPSLKEIPNK